MPQFSRPQAAREIEARARARALGVRVEVVAAGAAYAARSQSEPGVVYTMTRERDGWHCTCRGFVFTGVCKHLAQVERRSEREGWNFGRIGRPGRVDQIDWETGVIHETIHERRARLGLAPLVA